MAVQWRETSKVNAIISIAPAPSKTEISLCFVVLVFLLRAHVTRDTLRIYVYAYHSFCWESRYRFSLCGQIETEQRVAAFVFYLVIN